MKIYLLMKFRTHDNELDETSVEGVFASKDIAAEALDEKVLAEKALAESINYLFDEDYINVDFRIDEHVITSLANNPLYCRPLKNHQKFYVALDTYLNS
tara:strand:+ start:434 stop:730 length:297 start_codon:yes stop_codon:yes gene_type:complete